MSTLMARGTSMLNRLAGVAAAVAGTLTWPDSVTTTITTDDGVIAGRSGQTVQLPDGDGLVRMSSAERTLLAPVDSITKNGTVTAPVVGLRWTETINGAVCYFAVMPNEDGAPFDYCDTGRTRWRINLKRILTP